MASRKKKATRAGKRKAIDQNLVTSSQMQQHQQLKMTMTLEYRQSKTQIPNINETYITMNK